MGNEQAKSEVATGFGIQSMDQQLQRKFSKGIQFNSKLSSGHVSKTPSLRFMYTILSY